MKAGDCRVLAGTYEMQIIATRVICEETKIADDMNYNDRVIHDRNSSDQGDPRQRETTTGVWNHCQGSRAKRHREMEVSIENYQIGHKNRTKQKFILESN